LSNIPNGAYAVPAQMISSIMAYKKQRIRRQGPDTAAKIISADKRGGVRFFQIAAQFGKYFVKAYANGYGNANLTLNTLTNGIGKLSGGRFEIMQRTSNIQPCFVRAKRFYLIGIFREKRLYLA